MSTDQMTRRKAANRGWEGPYRYRMPDAAKSHAAVINGWIMKRGIKWLHFYSIRDGHARLPLTEERYMVKLQPTISELI